MVLVVLVLVWFGGMDVEFVVNCIGLSALTESRRVERNRSSKGMTTTLVGVGVKGGEIG
jgi:hypothetical protein